jgi:nucleoside-diphosphate-sugar epimerase
MLKESHPLPEDDLQKVVNSVLPFWPDLNGKRIFMTGGTGFVGAWLIESLLLANKQFGLQMELHLLSRDPTGFLRRRPHLSGEPSIKFCRGDVRHFDLPRGDFPLVIHAAADASRDHGRASVEIPGRDQVDGTSRLLTLLDQCRPERVLHVSSGAVYGAQPSEMEKIDEEQACTLVPNLDRAGYGLAKLFSEYLLGQHSIRSGYRLSVARCFAFAGPLLPLNGPFALGNFVRDALTRGEIRVEGDGTPIRSYLYAADLATWLWTMLWRAPANSVYNVGADSAVDMRTLALRVADLLCAKRVTIAGTANFEKPPSRYVPSVDKARRDLQVTATFDLDDAIRRHGAWLMSGA